MERGKWIFLRSKLPTEVAPPAMSIHYAIPWAMENTFMNETFGKRVQRLRKLLKRCAYIDEEELNIFYSVIDRIKKNIHSRGI